MGEHFSRGRDLAVKIKSVRHRLYKEMLRGCSLMATDDGRHVLRVCNLIMDHLSWQEERSRGGGGAEEDITSLFVDIALLVGTFVESSDERMRMLTTVHDNAGRFFARHGWKAQGSSYATVNRARLIGAMRMAMGGSELTESFIREFDEQPLKRKTPEKTAMTFVFEMMKKRQGKERR